MRYTPKTEKELATDGLWPNGVYDFEVMEAEDTTSQKSGNDMVKLKIKVFNDDGASRTVYDYLVGTDSAQFKVRGFAAAVGLLNNYETGEMSAVDMEGRTGKCKLIIQEDKTGQYPDKNSVSAYIAQAEKPKAAPRRAGIAQPAERRVPVAAGGVSWDAPKAAARDLDDEIPF